MLLYLRQMLQLLLAPAKGWEDLAACPITSREAIRRGLLPLAAAAGATVFFRAIYVKPDWTAMVTECLEAFMQYMITFYFGTLLMAMIIPRLTDPGKPTAEERINLFMSFPVGMMAVIGILAHLLPPGFTLINFLPLAVVVVMFSGRDFLGVPADRQGAFTALTIASAILPVYLIEWLFEKFLA